MTKYSYHHLYIQYINIINTICNQSKHEKETMKKF